MTDAHTAVIPAALGLSYSIALDKDGRRQMVLQGHLPIDAPQVQLDELADRMSRTAERQGAIFELKQCEIELQEILGKLHELELQTENTRALSQARWEEEKKRGEWTESSLSPKERQAIDGISSSRIKYTEHAKRLQETIDRLREVVGGDGTDVSTDRDPGGASG